jgi:hypothetical protein
VTERAVSRAQVNELVAGSSVRTSVDAASEDGQQRRPSLATGSGARRLGLVRPHPTALQVQRPSAAAQLCVAPLCLVMPLAWWQDCTCHVRCDL